MDIQNQQPMTFREHLSLRASDQRVTQEEATALKQHIDLMQISGEDRQALHQMVDQLHDATNDKFLFWDIKSDISPEEQQGLKELAKNNRLAAQVLSLYNSAANGSSLLDPGLTKAPPGTAQDSALQSPAPGRAYQDRYGPPSGRPAPPIQRHTAPPNQVDFPSRTSPVGSGAPMGNMETELYQAIMNYPGNKASDAEARQIARTLNEAAQTMGFTAENTRKMLAVFAHESGGFDVDARSHTGAGGLGQLTGIAIEDMDRLSSGSGPYAHIRDRLVRPGGNRDDIDSNVWTSVAYMHHLMGQIDSQDIGDAFIAYNTGVGGYNALMTMNRADAAAYLESRTGVQGKANEALAYSGHVNRAYEELFA